MAFSSKFLVKVSIYVAVGGFSSVMIMRQFMIDKVRRQEYFRSVLKEVRGNETAKSLLGEPIREVGLDLGHPNYANSEKVHFEIRVSGSKDKGSVFFWAEKPKEVEEWKVSRIEFQVKNDDKRLVIKKTVES